ncbi:MAG: hypothetical protein Q8N99_04760 [Nanoarchaeota archaeon]|nr:hypothetical protein [Nanoarchaeota archaeon]
MPDKEDISKTVISRKSPFLNPDNPDSLEKIIDIKALLESFKSDERLLQEFRYLVLEAIANPHYDIRKGSIETLLATTLGEFKIIGGFPRKDRKFYVSFGDRSKIDFLAYVCDIAPEYPWEPYEKRWFGIVPEQDRSAIDLTEEFGRESPEIESLRTYAREAMLCENNVRDNAIQMLKDTHIGQYTITGCFPYNRRIYVSLIKKEENKQVLKVSCIEVMIGNETIQPDFGENPLKLKE